MTGACLADGMHSKMLLVAPLLLVALAGCFGADGPGGEDMMGSALTFRDPVDLVCPDHPHYQANEARGSNCGAFGEPQLEVAGDGTIWYSAVCCVGISPPIWLSHDDGETFEALPFADGTGGSRDAFGVEGDFAIDDAGNVYFFDISAVTAYFTKYEADGSHVHTKPDPFPPLVDRPWVRAGAEDEVFILYNTGVAGSNFYRSDDGGLTWDYPGSTNFPCPLMTLGQGPVRDHLIASGCSGAPAAWISMDGGATWGPRIDLPLPAGQSGTEQYMQPAADAAGISYVPVTHTVDDAGENTMISVFAIHPDGTIAGPFPTTSETGLVDKPWLVAGKQGVVAFAYYGADNVTRTDEAEQATWHLKITYSLDAHTDAPTWTTVVADPEPVLEGTFGRNLGDFLQLRQTPDGGLAVAYAMRDETGLTNRFVRSDMGPDFGPEVFRNGP